MGKSPKHLLEKTSALALGTGLVRKQASRTLQIRVPSMATGRHRSGDRVALYTPFPTLTDHYAHFMPEAGKRGLAAMDSWLASQGPQRKTPEKSLSSLPITGQTRNPQVRKHLEQSAAVKVKYKETARGGLAVNVIEC